MDASLQIGQTVQELSLSSLLVIGMLTVAALFLGKSMRYVRMPSIIGFMVIGVIAGPSVLNLINGEFLGMLGFVTQIALGFVALSIGFELKLATLKRQGRGIILIILSESFMAFIAVSAAVYILTASIPLALIYGAIAPASDPAGTVAVIQEYKTRGNLTNALYSVVGFDDGLGIIIFGFAASTARLLVAHQSGGSQTNLLILFLTPLLQIGMSLGIGMLLALFFTLLTAKDSDVRDLFILIFGFVLMATGISMQFNLSIILTNMMLGIVAVNIGRRTVLQKIRSVLVQTMPLVFVLFFILAGASLSIRALPALGLLGVVYIIGRTVGLVGGAWFGAVIGRSEQKIRKYLGMGILCQAGVAIGLALVVQNEFSQTFLGGVNVGSTVITSVTATSIFFNIVGPIFTRIGLSKGGEIKTSAA
jgi:Kef-type K+ transport system membrane component KefB